MPIYEYQCTDCGNEFSRLQPIGANADGVRCPKCKCDTVERQLSVFASTSSSPDVGCPAASTCSSGFS